MSTIGVLRKLIHHDEPLRDCDGFPRVLANSLAMFRLVTQLDEAWNAEVARGNIAYLYADELEIAGYYQDWLVAAQEIDAELTQSQGAGVSFEDAATFRRCLTEVRGLLTTDPEFFGGQELAKLRDDAIDSHRRGESVEIQEFGD
jgi:hypothetical protein